MHKVWKGKLKEKQHQRKKGSKPLDVKGNQNKYSKEKITSVESKMAEYGGKRKKNQVKCQSCGGDRYLRMYEERY